MHLNGLPLRKAVNPLPRLWYRNSCDSCSGRFYYLAKWKEAFPRRQRLRGKAVFSAQLHSCCCTYHRILCPQFPVKTYTRVRNIHMALSLRKGSVFKEKPVVGQSCSSFVVIPRFDRLLSNCPVYFPVKGETWSTTILFAASAGKQC